MQKLTESHPFSANMHTLKGVEHKIYGKFYVHKSRYYDTEKSDSIRTLLGRTTETVPVEK